MIDVKSFSCGVRTRHVYGWVTILWFTSALSVGNGVELQAVSELAAQCGDNVTLTCDATLQKNLEEAKFFAWEAENLTCLYKDSQPAPGVLCESLDNPLTHRLTLTLRNVMPVNEGPYICKLRSNMESKTATTFVKVHSCPGTPGHYINQSHAKCWFSGVYPSGTIHWSQGDVNLTDSNSTQKEKDAHGRYNISSTIDVQRGNPGQPYSCSLWIPSVGILPGSHQTLPQRSAGSLIGLQWSCLMLEIVMVIFFYIK